MLQPGWLLFCHHTLTYALIWSMICAGSQFWLPLYTKSCFFSESQQGLSTKISLWTDVQATLCRSSQPLHFADRFDLIVPGSHTSLCQCWAFAVVGPSLWSDTRPAVWSMILQWISLASLRCMKTSIHWPVTLRALLNSLLLNSLLQEALYKWSHYIT